MVLIYEIEVLQKCKPCFSSQHFTQDQKIMSHEIWFNMGKILPFTSVDLHKFKVCMLISVSKCHLFSTSLSSAYSSSSTVLSAVFPYLSESQQYLAFGMKLAEDCNKNHWNTAIFCCKVIFSISFTATVCCKHIHVLNGLSCKQTSIHITQTRQIFN